MIKGGMNERRERGEAKSEAVQAGRRKSGILGRGRNALTVFESR